MKSERELAYRYDLYVVPYWRESFDQMVMKHVEIPRRGSILQVNCGTGGLAIEMATSLGNRGDVLATDTQAERLGLARAKAEVKKLTNIIFLDKSPTDLGMEDYLFDLVVGDAALMPPEQIESMVAEMARLAEVDATVALLMLTHGSFGEVFSLLWEALYHCQLEDYTPRVEALINEYHTTSQAREMMQRQGLSHVHSFTEPDELDFASAQELFESPLIEDYFLDHWLEFLPDAATRQRVINQMAEIIDRERQNAYVDISVKASLLVGRRQ
jgi:ubiquinone/menaquinone biosynthesis C-methylase UbiE